MLLTLVGPSFHDEPSDSSISTNSPPTVRVNTAYTGATAQVVNDMVASVIETQIGWRTRYGLYDI